MPGSSADSTVDEASATVCVAVIVHSTPWFQSRSENTAVAVSPETVTVAPCAATSTPSTAPIRSAATVAVLATGVTAVLESSGSSSASASGVAMDVVNDAT